MKRVLLICLLSVIPYFARAQVTSFGELYEKYGGRDGFSTVDMAGEVFQAIAGNDSSVVMSNIDRLVILINEEHDAGFDDDVEDMLSCGGYSTVSMIRDGGQSVGLYMKRCEGTDDVEFVIAMFDGSDSLVMSIRGDGLSIDQVNSLVNMR